MRVDHRLERLNLEEDFDVIIIGGGVNGAGVARDAAERGLKVLLLEKNDFSYGCSAHSTRLIHGGLRYLEHFEFPLVYESLQERETLLKNYPQYVNPLGLFIPAYQGNRVPLWKLKMGMRFYDFLSTGKSMDGHKAVNLDQIGKLDMDINADGLEGGVYYFDGQVNCAERMILDNILTAEDKGAICLNHCEVIDIITNKLQGKTIVQGVKFRDRLNSNRSFTAYGKNVINMAGPWVDKTNKLLKDTNSIPIDHNLEKRISGTKGSHIVVRSFPGAPKDFGIYNEAKSDGRPFFILPFKIGMNEDLYLIGTTDIFISEHENLDGLKISQKEINYLLTETNDLFPEANLKMPDIVNTFVGVRPLAYKAKDSVEGNVTRRHFIVDHSKEGIEHYYSVIGGKWTTFRSLAEEVVNKITSNKCFTKKKKTLSSEFPSNMKFYDYVREKTKLYTAQYEVDAHTILHLIMLYGAKASEVLDLCQENPLLKNKVTTGFEDIEAQIVYAIRKEKAYTIDDIIKRRLSIGLCTSNFNKDVLKTIKYHLEEEFELQGRQRDKIIEAMLVGTYTI